MSQQYDGCGESPMKMLFVSVSYFTQTKFEINHVT